MIDEEIIKELFLALEENQLDIFQLKLQNVKNAQAYLNTLLLNALFIRINEPIALTLFKLGATFEVPIFNNIYELDDKLNASAHDLMQKDSMGNSLLHYAVAGNNRPIAQELSLLFPEMVTHQNKQGQTPLHLAAHFGWQEIFDDLYNLAPALLNKLDNEGVTPIHLSILSKNLSFVEYLSQLENADFLALTHYNRNVLHYAVMSKEIAMFDLLLNLFPELSLQINAQDEDGDTPFMYAVESNDLEWVGHLSQQSGISYLRNFSLENPVHVAASHNHEFLTLHLIEKNPKWLMQTDITFCTPLADALPYPKLFNQLLDLLETQSHLFKSKENISPLEFSIVTLLDHSLPLKDTTLFRTLIAKIDHLKHYRRCLTYSIKQDDLTTYQKFSAHFSEDELQNLTPPSLLIFATRCNAIHIVQYLLTQQTLSKKEKDNHENTALLVAAQQGSIPTFELLLKNGSHLNEKNKYQANVLHQAAFGKQSEMVFHIYKKNPGLLTEKNKHQDTPLINACISGKADIIFFLLLAMNDGNLKNSHHMLQTLYQGSTQQLASNQQELEKSEDSEKKLNYHKILVDKHTKITKHLQPQLDFFKKTAKSLNPSIQFLFFHQTKNPFFYLPKEIKAFVIHFVFSSTLNLENGSMLSYFLNKMIEHMVKPIEEIKKPKIAKYIPPHKRR